jgi:membrane protein DedA with SNARE-associated domain
MSDIVSPLLEWLNANPEWAGAATFAISAAESIAIIGTIVPGSITMTAIGALAGAQVIPLWSTIFWAILGAIVGDGISYWMGYYFKDRLHRIWPFKNNPAILERGEIFVHKYGVMSVFIGRFVGPVRALVPLVAGMLGMRPLQFTIANVTSAIGWAPAYMLPGILLGAASLELPPDIAIHVILVLLLITLFIMLCLWLIYKICQLVHHQTTHLQNWIWNSMKKSRAFSPIIYLLKRRHTKKPHGQLVLAFYLFLILLALVILCVYIAKYGPANLSINNVTFHLFRGVSVRNEVIDHFMIGTTLFGQKEILIPVFAILILWLLFKKRWYTALHVIALSALAVASIFALKHIVQSPRPWGIAQSPEIYSMPSGHTAMAVAFFFGIGALIASALPTRKRWPIYATAFFITILVGVSRLYLGAHWLTDVLAGWLLGMAVVLLVTISYRRDTDKPTQPFTIFMVSLFAFILSYGVYYIRHADYLQAQYAQIMWPVEQFKMEHWWEKNAAAPAYRVSLFGFPSQRINFEWVGNIDNIRDILMQEGWSKPPARDWISTLHRIADIRSTEFLPMISPQYLDKSPALILTRIQTPKKGLLVIRLWAANRLTESGEPLWVGILDNVPRSYSWIFKKHASELTIDPALVFPIQNKTANLEWKTIIVQEPARYHKTVHQKILLIRTKK